MPASSKAARAASTVGLSARSGESQGLNTSKEPKRRERIATAFEEDRTVGVACAPCRRGTARARRRPRPASRTCTASAGGSPSRESAISCSDIGLRRQALGLSAPLRKALAAIVCQDRRVESLLVQVALDLHPEELGGEHEAGLAVPRAEAHRRRVDVEGPAVVLVEARRPGRGRRRPTAMRVVGALQRTATGRAAVPHVDEGQRRSDRGRRPGCRRRRRPCCRPTANCMSDQVSAAVAQRRLDGVQSPATRPETPGAGRRGASRCR